jgi:Dolichyl-phosphate-mannose-protein mannosyltransferase
VTKDPVIIHRQAIPIRVLLLLVGVGALLAGLYGRFKGIGTWPLGVDEYYISRSIDNVMRRGLPQFDCGGYYMRGLLYQYLVAGMRWCGMQPEFAGRLLAGICSLAVLPAAYGLAKRVAGSQAALVTIIILSISVWEIEMARFARMYAPFQAVFTWYLVFFLRYTIDRNKAALVWLIALSVLGVLTWEGGVLLGVANLLAVVLAHDHGRLRAADWRRFAGLVLLLGLLFLATRDLRGFAGPPASDAGSPSSHLAVATAGLAPVWQHPVWALTFLLPLGLLAGSLPWIWSYRRQWMIAAGLCVVLAAAAMHLFNVSGGVLALMLLAKLIDWHDLTAAQARRFALALVALLIFWLAFDIWAGSPMNYSAFSGTSAKGPPPVIHDLFGFPDIYDEIIRPWGHTVPILSLGLAAALAFWCWKAIADRRAVPDSIPALLSLIALMALAVGATATERIETRYTFFLYPLFIVLSVAALLKLVQSVNAFRHAPIAFAVVVPLLAFSATEDFQPRHIAHVDSADINFRVGMSAVRAAHYYPRDDIRSVGQWLATHVRPGEVVITGIPSLDQYYSGFDYFFLDEEDLRYEAYVCQDGKTERWTNHPVLYGERALKPIVASGRRVYASLYPDDEDRLWAVAQSEGWSVRRVRTAGYVQTDVLLIAANDRVMDAP